MHADHHAGRHDRDRAAPSSSYIFGQTITLSTTFKSTAAPAVWFTGTATITDQNSDVLGTATLAANGAVKFALTGVVPGTHDCTLSYPGDTNHTATSSAFTLQVNQAATTTALTASAAAPVFGQQLTLTAAVKATPATAPHRQRRISGQRRGLANRAAQRHDQQHQFHLHRSRHWQPSYQAIYLGDSNFKTSNSSLLKRTVNKDKTSIVLTSTLASPMVNQTFNLNVQVTVLAPGVSMLTGNLITIKDNGQVLTTTLSLDSSGDVTLPGLTYTAAGTHSLTAIYAGDADTLAVTSSALKLTIT